MLSPEADSEGFFVSAQTKSRNFPNCTTTSTYDCYWVLLDWLFVLIIKQNLYYFDTIHCYWKILMFSFPIFVRLTQTILLRGRKCISFSKWQVRSVVILSEERWVLKCVFEPRSLIKKGKEMTLFSLHHNSNFLGLVPPALWRDPGHCAAGRRGKTERITHPGKTDV